MPTSRKNNTLRGEFQSLSAVGELKSVTDTKDKYLIYKINDINHNGKMSYVFKFSRTMALMAIDMEQKEETGSPLKDEYCYFDGMHSRCATWKTLTSWVYHPPSRKLLCLATMECKGETTEAIATSWKHFNKVLQELKNDANYKFNPIGFITDKGGANMNGLLQVFGQQVMHKIKTCQFHFRLLEKSAWKNSWR